MTLAGAFETVATKLAGSCLTSLAFEEVAGETSYIGTMLNVNPLQVFILATMMHNWGRKMEVREFADFAAVSPIRIMALQRDFDELADKGFIVCPQHMSCNDLQQAYALSAGLVRAVRYNKAFEAVSYEGLTAQEVLDMIKSLLHDSQYGKIGYSKLVEQFEKLLAETRHVDFCRKVGDLQLNPEDLVLFLIAVECLVFSDEDIVTSVDYEEVLPVILQRQMVSRFKNGTHLLSMYGLMEATDRDCDAYRITKRAKAEYLKDFGIEVDDTRPDDGPDGSPDEEDEETVVEKQLFYNPSVREQVERLKSLLSVEKFEEVQHRMRAVGMRPGFACLFYGGPGTGKTETVLQLARATGREVVQVNVANLRNLYVGESEKNTQRVFDDYREKLEESDLVPILLFNEADGIFGNRYKGVSDAVNQMENTIQNIILQNMETFEGILIATTNLTENFDAAFERRFLFKICFENPRADVRKLIWMSVLPKLTADEAAVLAARYDFTGSMIENVARRQTIDEVLYGRPLTLDTMKRLCEEEQIKKPAGFRRGPA